MTKRFIVITSINPKSRGVEQFERMPGWHTLVVGDRKSVPIESSDNLTFFSIDDQLALGYHLVDVCPCNHYTRKNIGYLYAIAQGADIIFDTDDDNLPYEDWAPPPFSCARRYDGGGRFVNIYAYFSQTT